jgi:hypothetical protein
MMMIMMFIFMMAYMSVYHLMDKGFWLEGTAPAACGGHGNELACFIKGRCVAH